MFIIVKRRSQFDTKLMHIPKLKIFIFRLQTAQNQTLLTLLLSSHSIYHNCNSLPDFFLGAIGALAMISASKKTTACMIVRSIALRCPRFVLSQFLVRSANKLAASLA